MEQVRSFHSWNSRVIIYGIGSHIWDFSENLRTDSAIAVREADFLSYYYYL